MQTKNQMNLLEQDNLVVFAAHICSRTPLIRINWYGEPAGYADNLKF
jgi:hypothetical protein